VKDVDRQQLIIRDDKGAKVRVAVLPQCALDALKLQLESGNEKGDAGNEKGDADHFLVALLSLLRFLGRPRVRRVCSSCRRAADCVNHFVLPPDSYRTLHARLDRLLVESG
jgi:hypothetical protein